MYGILFKILKWTLEKAVFYMLIFGLLLALFLIRQLPEIILNKQEAALEERIERIRDGETLLSNLQDQVDGIRGKIQSNQENVQELEKERAKLDTLWRTLTNIFAREALRRQRGQLDALIDQKQQEIAQLQAQIAHISSRSRDTAAEQEQRKAEVATLERQLQQWHEINNFLDDLFRLHLKLVAIEALKILMILLILPVLWKILAFYLLAPLVQNARPINFSSLGKLEMEDIGPFQESKPAIQTKLNANDVLLLRENFLQSSTEHSDKKTQYLMNWSYPFTSLACGLYLLTAIRPKNDRATDLCQVTLSCQSDSAIELSQISLQQGSMMVFRPMFLAGLSFPHGKPPRIRSKWVFNRLHCWVNLRFRYLTIEGPVKLFFAAQRGVQMEAVQPVAGRRVNSNLTIGYSPQINHSPRRAETFLAYFRGANPLFDDFFAGQGLTINQQVAGNSGSIVRSLWEGFFNAFRKIFGL